MVDFASFVGSDQVIASRHGDQKGLIALLRSDEPLTRFVRDYLADELEREPKKRFSRKYKSDPNLRTRDRLILTQVRDAKRHLLFQSLPKDLAEDVWMGKATELWDQWALVSDHRALGWLMEQGISIEDHALENAKRRNQNRMHMIL